jgi:hypothetical protein
MARRVSHPGATLKYIPPFDLIRRSVEISTMRGELRVNVSYEDFIRILKKMILATEVDEDWYLQTYADIAQAVRDGIIKSARHHFVEDGWFEGRLPFPINVDERWYAASYPDVGESVRRGAVPSAQAHFEDDGYREGRLPFDM